MTVNARLACWFGAALSIYGSGCSDRNLHKPAETISTTDDQLSESGIERVIPIHFALLRTSASNPPTLTLTQMERMVREANFVYRVAGLQFYISAIDNYVTPSLFINSSEGPLVSWSSVVADIRKVFPNAPLTLTLPTSNSVMHWLTLASSNWGPVDEIFISVTEGASNTQAPEPWYGRGITATGMSDFSTTGTFVHELGHYFGLPHLWEIPNDPGGTAPTDPETGQPVTMDDYWDLIYGYENPPVFFSTRDEAVAYTGMKKTKDKPKDDGHYGDGINCRAPDTSTCNVTCDLDVPGGTYSVHTGEPGGEGISFTFAGDNPPTTYARGTNIEIYWGCETSDPNRLFSISRSQIRMIQKNLRFRQIQKCTSPSCEYIANGVFQPTYRDLLGKYTGNQSLSYNLDFDGDGKRDIAVFRPPSDAIPGHTGQFFILKSSSGYTTSMTVNFGTLGDVPVPADYDGDGKTDVAVWRTMGPNGDDPTDHRGLWLWCGSSTNATCSTAPSPVYWGERDDVPLPGTNFDGDSTTGELAVYRPSTKTFFWIKSPFTSGSWTASMSAESAAVPIVGLFDSDNKTDVVLYSPSTTTFNYLLSTSDWGVEGSRSFGLGPTIPMTDPMTGPMTDPSMQRAPFPVTTYASGKQVLSIWDPNSGVYHTMWDWETSPTDSTCWWGGPSDIPIGTSIDRNSDGHSDRLIRRNNTNAVTETLFFDSAYGSCDGDSLGVTLSSSSWGPRTLIFSGMDAGGDGNPDIWLFNPDAMTWSYMSADFSSSVAPIQWGAPKDLPL
jgi:hypothetical protein